MSRPFTLLEDLCRHALSIGSDSIEVEYRDDREWVYGRKDNTSVSFASFASSSADAKELRDNLYRAHKKPLRTVLDGKVYALKARIADSFGEDAFAVKIEPAPKLDPTAAPRFTKTQGQYLAFIYYYTKIHGLAPAESDLQSYFRVSAPSVHEMIKTLERNALIERTPGRARSIRLLVQPEHLPQLR
jgi:DNA-binding MarR family transcriptional regulator